MHFMAFAMLLTCAAELLRVSLQAPEVAWHGMSSQRFTLGSANITRDTGHWIG